MTLQIGSEYWQERFASGGWGRAGGNLQSLLFMHEALEYLHTSPLGTALGNAARIMDLGGEHVAGLRMTIHDFGCAEGDGTAVLAARFPFAEVVGFDFSASAVERARERWPTIRFEVGDVHAPVERSALTITSHTLEHVLDPPMAISALRAWTEWLVVIVPPISAEVRGGHEDSKLYSEWRPLVSPVWDCHYNSVRWNVERDKPLIEGNVLLLFKGTK